jgi:hypothetical protein
LVTDRGTWGGSHVIQRQSIVSGRTRILVMVAIAAGMIASVVAAAQGEDDSRFAPVLAAQIGGRPVRLILTGTAVRTKYMLSVYTIGSYLQEGAKVRDGEELARVAAPKLLHLIFERNVAGDAIAQSFRDAIGMNNPPPAFAAELDRLDRVFRAGSVHRGDHVWLTFIPGTGLACQLAGQPVVLIENVAFARAAWEVYLGRKNLGAAIQMGLTSRL